MLVTDSYSKLIDWSDPDDPLRVLLVPQADEESIAGSYDQSGEADSTVVRGLQHKYEQTAAMVVTEACAAHCRYCFRRRLMSFDVVTREGVKDLAEPLAYIAEHDEIDNVLLTGGDPMVSSTRRLAGIFEGLSNLDHIRQVRISTKLLAFLPSRFDDPELEAVLRDAADRFQVVFQCHYDHPREIHDDGRRSIERLSNAGCLLTSQIAYMSRINDGPDVLGKLLYELHLLGVVPQYIFHPRPVRHATHFQMPIVDALTVIEAVKARFAGPIKRFRYIMTMADGKLELVGTTRVEGEVTLVARWHQLRRGVTRDPIVLLPIDEDAVWLDEAQLPA